MVYIGIFAAAILCWAVLTEPPAWVLQWAMRSRSVTAKVVRVVGMPIYAVLAFAVWAYLGAILVGLVP